jgi:hypothetical protein
VDKPPAEEDDEDEGECAFAFFRFGVPLGAADAGNVDGVGTTPGSAVAADSGPAPFFLRLFFFAGGHADAGAVVGADAELSERAAISSAIPSGVSASCGGGNGGAASPVAGAAVIDASAVVAAAVAVAVAIADADALVFVSTRGTSTKSAVSDRGELSGDEEERTSEEDKDQTISSSSEAESLAHLVLEVSESMSRDDDREVVMVYCQEEEGKNAEIATVVNDDIDYLLIAGIRTRGM